MRLLIIAKSVIYTILTPLCSEEWIYSYKSIYRMQSLAEASAAPVAGGGRGVLSEATDALLVLGYSRAEALNALKDLNTDSGELEEIIRLALKKLMKF